MKVRWLATFMLAIGLVFILMQAGVAQGPGLTPEPENLTPAIETPIANNENLPTREYLNEPISAMAETLTVPFASGTAGVRTSQSYTGLVTVTITGVGQAAGTAWSDAFYVYTDYSGQPITPVHPTSFHNWTLWINGGPADNFVQPIPPYSPDHRYTLIINAPGGPLTFGVGDTLTWDNSGAYIVTVTAGSGPSLSISHLEVTQAIQDEANSAPVIAGKPTFVRAYVHCDAGCAEPTSVTGVLRGYGSSGELHGSPLTPNGSITVNHSDGGWQSQRADLKKTLNFTLPTEWTAESRTLTLTAEIAGAQKSEVVTFEESQTLSVGFVPINYRPPWWVLVCPGSGKPDDSRIKTAWRFAHRILPTAKVETLLMPTMDWTKPLCVLPWDLLKKGHQERKRQLFNALLSWSSFFAHPGDYVFGWLPDGSIDWDVEGEVQPYLRPDGVWVGRVGFGEDDPTEGPRTFVHELGHMLGRRHTNTLANLQDSNCRTNLLAPTDQQKASVDEGSDWLTKGGFDTSKIQDYGLDGYGFGWLVSSSGVVINPAVTYDYMSYCGKLVDGNVWTSPWTYGHIFSQTLKPQTTAPPVQALASQTYLIASGLVYTDNTAILDPTWVITKTTASENLPAGTTYCLEAQNAFGAKLAGYCFDLTFADYENGQPTGVDGFSLMLAYPSGVARIVLKKGVQELAERTVSTHPPAVKVTSPNGGENWAASGTSTITWTASDAEGDSLWYTVLYSPDGIDWMPVAMAITETQRAVDVAELAGGSGAKVRVLATDGVNTGSDESDGAFIVGSKEPQAYILSPEGDGSIPPSVPLFLQGYAYDLEDGTLGEGTLGWSSSRDGDLGNGSLVLVTLSQGQHIITLMATDSDGNVATDSLNVFVGNKVYLPTIVK